jgi:ubiquinone biosynthesis monooxygenase Coq7
VIIYAGQIFCARLTAPNLVSELIEFKSHEERHRAVFWTELQKRNHPKCRSYWLCGFGGFVLGLVTGLFGRHAISATTVAVERVVLRHLEQQLNQLRGQDEAAVEAIESIVAEERVHHDQAAKHIEINKFWSRLLMPVVSASTEAVVWIGMKA